jgi:hypothetical protein
MHKILAKPHLGDIVHREEHFMKRIGIIVAVWRFIEGRLEGAIED